MCLRSMTATKRSRQREGSFSVINDGRSPGKTPSLGVDSRAKDSSHQSPRSGVNVVGLRPSLIAQHSLRGFFSSIHAQGEGGFSVINDGRSPEKTASLRGGENPSHEKHKSARKSILALPIFVATPTRRRRPGHSSFLAFLASLAWDDFTQRAQSPRRGVGLGAALFVAFRGNSLLPVTAGGCRMTP